MKAPAVKDIRATTGSVLPAFRWLRDSGIQIKSQDPETEGGVCSWFDVDRASYPFIYSEITGYAVSAFLFQHLVTGDSSYLASAVSAGDWLLRSRNSAANLVPTRVRLEKTEASYYDTCFFTFDQWVIVYGLANLAAVCREQRFLDGAVSIARFLISKTLKPDGFFYPMFDTAKDCAVEFGDKWSRQAGSFHAKALMALSKLFHLTGESAYRDVAERLLEKTLSVQTAEGRFITQDSDQSTHLHPFYTR